MKLSNIFHKAPKYVGSLRRKEGGRFSAALITYYKSNKLHTKRVSEEGIKNLVK